MRRRIALLLAVLLGLGVLSGCGPTLGSLPLPGTGVSGRTIDVKADFDDALNLSPGAVVKVDGVDAGKVQVVKAKDFKAVVTMKVRKDARIRQGARARLRYTTPLGEVFVDVTNPTKGRALADGAVLAQTSTAPTVEDSLAEASLLINGGGLNQLQTITEELNKIFDGRVGTIRDVLGRSDALLREFNATTGDIDRALRALNAVSGTLHARRATIRAALRDVRPAARALRGNLPGLTKLLTRLDGFAQSANGTVAATRQQIHVLLSEAAPTLAQFASLRSSFGPTLDDIIRAGKDLDSVVPGDYLNMGIHLQLDGLVIGKNNTGPGKNGGGSGLPGLPELPGIPGLRKVSVDGLIGGGR